MRGAQRGVVLILVLVLIAALSVALTVFFSNARTGALAAKGALRGLQAEAACRAGLAAAIYRIDVTCQTAYGLLEAGSWHQYWEDPSGESLCPTGWADHYNNEKLDHGAVHSCAMRGRAVSLPWIAPAPLKYQKGFAAQYFVAVADLDGKLHSAPAAWDTEIKGDADKRKEMTKVWLSQVEPFKSDAARTDAAAAAIAGNSATLWSPGRMRAAFGLASAAETCAVESHLTVYPRVPEAPFRPAVNVNTAHRNVLKAIVLNVPGFNDALAGSVADKLVSKRPFSNRRDMETALLELGGSTWPAPYQGADNLLSEKQLNDLLNSLAGEAGAAPEEQSDYDDAAASGYYHCNFDDTDPEGECSSAAPAATWGAELKFTSRFFHVYVLGRTVAPGGRILSQRRAHAVYDAGEEKTLWFRWNFEAQANMMGP